jgi:hypothetical protein
LITGKRVVRLCTEIGFVIVGHSVIRSQVVCGLASGDRAAAQFNLFNVFDDGLVRRGRQIAWQICVAVTCRNAFYRKIPLGHQKHRWQNARPGERSTRTDR